MTVSIRLEHTLKKRFTAQSIPIKAVKGKSELWNKSFIWKSPITPLLSNPDKPLFSLYSRCLISDYYDPISPPSFPASFVFFLSFLLIKNPITVLIEASQRFRLEKCTWDRWQIHFYLLRVLDVLAIPIYLLYHRMNVAYHQKASYKSCMLLVVDYAKQKLIKKPIAPKLTVSEAEAATGWWDYTANLRTIKLELLRIIISEFCQNDL